MSRVKVICAPDSFKESIAARDAAAHMAAGVLRARPQATVDRCPVADGGEGFVDAVEQSRPGDRRTTVVCGPLDEPVEATWLLLREADGSMAAALEMASASGLALVPEDWRNPMKTTTFGTGELIRAALDAGARRLFIGIGGSATNDGGCGMAAALGVRFFDTAGVEIGAPGLAGGDLNRITRINVSNLDPRLGATEIIVACDVTNPLAGPNGAAAVYGPQKGATATQVERLDAGLAHLNERWIDTFDQDFSQLAGAGAAGGLGWGLVAFCGASMRSGVDLVLEAVGFDARVQDCDLCLTGEGKFDHQSSMGKACFGVARAAAKHGVPTIALVGRNEGNETVRIGDDHALRVVEIGSGLSARESMARAGELIERVAESVIREMID